MTSTRSAIVLTREEPRLPLESPRRLLAWTPVPGAAPGPGPHFHAVGARPHHPILPQSIDRGEAALPRLVEQAYTQLLLRDPDAALRTLESAVNLIGGPRLVFDASGQQDAPAGGVAVTPAPARPRVSVYTLGRFEVLVDRAPLCTGRKHPKRTLALLKALIAMGGRRVPRCALVDVLWPDIDGDLGQNALEVTLHRLRNRLGVADAIVARGGCLELDPNQVWVDALEFGAAPTDNDSGPSIKVEQAFALYRGGFLPDDRDASWSLRTREKLRARFVRIVAEAAAQLEASARFDAAARLYERALGVDDLACVFHDGLARCLQRLGRSSEAQMAVDRGSQLLKTGSAA